MFIPKYKKIAGSLVFLIFFYSGYNQNIKLIGSIYNRENNEPVQYANIAVRNMPIGTCTNFYGDFILNIPDSIATGSLDISCIGYKSYSLSLNSLQQTDTLIIFLHPVEYVLDDITVVPGQNDATTIMKKVIANMGNNYSRKKYYLEAFFRDRAYNRKDNFKTVRLTEAAISIHQDHKTSSKKKRIQIREVRNSNNYIESNTSFGKKFIYEMLGGATNPIHWALTVEEFTQKIFLKKMLKSQLYSVTLDGISFYDSALVFVVDFKQEYFTFLLKKYKTTHTFTNFRYHINANDFAVLKAECIYSCRNPKIPNGTFKNDSIADQKIIQYRKFDNKYYPSYIYNYGAISDMNDKYDQDHFYNHEVELMVNEIAIRRRDYERIKNRNLIKNNEAVWDLEYEYHPAFWENYNVLLYNPLKLRYKQDLEFEQSLEEQFRK